MRLLCLASFFYFVGLLHPAGGHRLALFGAIRPMSAFLRGGRLSLLLSVRGAVGVLFLELGKVAFLEEKAVPVGAREDFILKAEISHSDHGERLIHVRINEWSPVIMQGYNLWELSLVPHTMGNDQVATLKGSPMEQLHVCMLE